jgi:hypothetical protein
MIGRIRPMLNGFPQKAGIKHLLNLIGADKDDQFTSNTDQKVPKRGIPDAKSIPTGLGTAF